MISVENQKMNVNKILDDLLIREGPGDPAKGYLSKNDAGGRTNWGISERAHPEEWIHGPPTKERARQVFLTEYVQPFFGLASVISDRLIDALIDDGVMRGVDAAIKRFQWVLGVPPDGDIGPITIAAAKAYPGNGNTLLQRYVVERVIRITRLVQQRPTDLTNLTGWVDRILKFLPEV